MPHPFPNLPPEQRGRVHTLRHVSRALADNPWGDPAERDVYVYTPPGYDAGDDAYPALFLLPAYAGTGEALLGRGLTDVSIATRIDRLLADGCPPFVAVLPDTMTSLGGSQYLDSPGIGRYGTYVADELRAFVASRFRLTGRWGAIGRSSGGYGALRLAMDFPGTWHAVGSLAGDMGFDLCYLGDIPAALTGVRAAGGLEGFVPWFWTQHRPSAAAFAGLNLLCMACAYSPDPSARPVPARLPVDFETGAVDFDVLTSWRVHDPLVRVSAHRDALAALDLLFIDAGDRDEYNLHLGARRFSDVLERLGVPHLHEEFPGGHRGTSFRFDRALPLLANALAT